MYRNLWSPLIKLSSLCALVMALAFSGQSSQAQQAFGTPADLAVTDAEIAAAKSALGGATIGIVAATLQSDYHSTAILAATVALNKYGLRSQILDAKTDATKAASAIADLLGSGVKALIVFDPDPKVVQPAIKPAIDAGIPVIQYAGRSLAGEGVVTISVEDADLGVAAGAYAGALIAKELGGKAKVAILDYPSIANIVVRADNLEKALKAAAPNATIVGRFLGGTSANGQQSIQKALEQTPDINVVVSINDAGALGAIQSLVKAGKKPSDVIVIGVDGEKEALRNILDDYFFRATVNTSPKLTGQLMAQAVVKALAKSKFPRDIAVPVSLVTKDTLLNAEATPAPTAAATPAQ